MHYSNRKCFGILSGWKPSLRACPYGRTKSKSKFQGFRKYLQLIFDHETSKCVLTNWNAVLAEFGVHHRLGGCALESSQKYFPSLDRKCWKANNELWKMFVIFAHGRRCCLGSLTSMEMVFYLQTEINGSKIPIRLGNSSYEITRETLFKYCTSRPLIVIKEKSFRSFNV